MATKPVDPKLNRVWATFTVGSTKYQVKITNSRTQGTFFTHVGFADKGEAGEDDAQPISIPDAMNAGLLVKVNATCQQGSRTVTRVCYVPVNKIEEAFKSGAGKTIGTLKVVRVRSPRRRSYS